MGNIFKFVDEQGVEHDLNMTETVIDDSSETASSSKRTYSGSKIEQKIAEAKNLANATGTLAVAKGGTGATTAKGAQHNLLSDMNEVDSDFSDTDKIVVTYGTSSSSTGSVFKRSALRLWNYIKGKIQSTALTLAGAINFTGTVKKNNVDLATTSDLSTAITDLIENDCNKCIGTLGVTKVYLVPYSSSLQNAPFNAGGWVEVYRGRANASVTQQYIRQVWRNGSGSGLTLMYERTAVSDDGITWTWGEWHKITTETDLTNTLENYAQGKQTALPTGADLNNYKDRGEYLATTDAIANSCINRPKAQSSIYGFSMSVHNSGNGIVTQKLYCVFGVYVRRYSNTWTSWEQIATATDLATVQNSIKTTKVDNAVHADTADSATNATNATNAESAGYANDAGTAVESVHTNALGHTYSPPHGGTSLRFVGSMITARVSASPNNKFMYGSGIEASITWGSSGNYRTVGSPDVSVLIYIEGKVYVVPKGNIVTTDLSTQSTYSGIVLAVLDLPS